MLDELKSQHREVARLTVEGYKPTQIADYLNMSLQTVYGIRHDPLFRQHVEYLEDQKDEGLVDVRRELTRHASKAVQKLGELLESPDEKVQLSTAKDVLDRAGYNPKQEFQHKHLHAHLDKSDIENLKSRAKSAGAVVSDEEVIDTSYEENTSPDSVHK